MFGAMGVQLGKKPAALKGLRESLNPVSRFDFGMLHGLGPHGGLAGPATGTVVNSTPAKMSCLETRSGSAILMMIVEVYFIPAG